MARKTAAKTNELEEESTETTTSSRLPMTGRDSTRLTVILLGSVILMGALISPWWTRGTNIDEEALDEQTDGAGFFVPGAEGFYLNYAPFRTPGGGTLTVDASRAAAVAVLGVSLVACAVFAAASNVVRLLSATGRIERNDNAPVRLSILAFLFGTFAVLWGLFFLPLAGDNPGMMWGDERPTSLDEQSSGIAETTRYANVGFYLGIVGAMAYPAFLWFDANRVRQLNMSPTTNWTPSKQPVTF